MTDSSKIEVGVVVRVGVLDDAPQMTVNEATNNGGNDILCYWFDKSDNLQKDWFRKDQLIVL